MLSAKAINKDMKLLHTVTEIWMRWKWKLRKIGWHTVYIIDMQAK